MYILYFLGVLIVLNLATMALMISVLWPRKIDKDVSRLLRRFEKEKDCMVRIEMIDGENVYIRNPQR